MKDRLREVLAGRIPRHLTDSNRAASAVLVPIFMKDGELHVLFIRRSANVRTHRGQMAFPGGGFEKTDGDLLHTALRECREEIALQPADVEVLGQLHEQLSATSLYIITPFVGLIPFPYPLQVDGTETAAIMSAPISSLLNEGRFHEEVAVDEGRWRTTYYYHCGADIVWGATARILTDFLEVFARASQD